MDNSAYICISKHSSNVVVQLTKMCCSVVCRPVGLSPRWPYTLLFYHYHQKWRSRIFLYRVAWPNCEVILLLLNSKQTCNTAVIMPRPHRVGYYNL